MVQPVPEKTRPKWTSEFKPESRMVKVHVLFRMSRLRRDP